MGMILPTLCWKKINQQKRVPLVNTKKTNQFSVAINPNFVCEEWEHLDT